MKQTSSANKIQLTDNTQSIIRQSSNDLRQMESELRLTLEEIARLQNSLAEANMKITALEASISSQPIHIDGNHLIKPVLQELHQPLHTIQGYLDLLTNESVGVLGTFQKRFLERIASSVGHMEGLLSHLENQTGGTEEDSQQFIKEFSLTSVTEEAVALFTELIRNKSIILKVEFESEEIRIINDLEKIERVLNIIFTNSFSSVQDEGTITLGLKLLRGKKPAQVLLTIQSTDKDCDKSKPLPVNLDEFKDLDIKLEGFGCTLKELMKARSIVEEVQGQMEVFSIPSCGSLIRVRLQISR